MYVLMPVVIITGAIFMWPDLARKSTFGYHGLLPIAVLHYLSAVVLITFLVSHFYLGTCGSRVAQHFKMMITGWHEH